MANKMHAPTPLLILFFCLFSSFIVKAQSPSPFQGGLKDSVFVLQWLADATQEKHSDSLLNLLQNTYFLAQKLGYKKGIQQAATALAKLAAANGNTATALRYRIEILEIVRNQQQLMPTIQELIHIAAIYEQEKLYVNALTYYEQARQLAQENKLLSQEIELNQLIGEAFSNNQQPDSAFYYLQKNIAYFKEQPTSKSLIDTYQKIVFNFITAKDYHQSLTYNLKIKDLLERNKDTQQLAIIYNNIGYDYNALQDYAAAIEYFELAVTLNEKGYLDKATLFTHLGIAHHNQKAPQKAIDYLNQAKAALTPNKQIENAKLAYLIAVIYLNVGDVYNAFKHNVKAEKEAKEANSRFLLVDIYENAANIHQTLYEYETALDYYKKHLLLRDSFELEERLRQVQLLQQQSELERAEKEIKLLLVNQDIQDLKIGQLELEKEKLQLGATNLELETARQKDELVLLKRAQQIKEANLRNKDLQNKQAQQQLNLTRQKLLAAQQNQQISNLQRIEAEKELELKQKEVLEKAQVQQITLLEKEQSIANLELEKSANFQRFAYGIGGLLSLILLMILGGLFYSRKTNQQLASQKAIIEQEKSKSDALLLNILPQETANELKEKGRATPKDYEDTTVLFSDFSGFTSISQNMQPQALLEELNTYFIAFDEIMEKHNLEKIKTIGDAYMCVAGIPVERPTHAVDAVNAAIDMLAFHQERLKQKQAANLPHWDMRLGMHSGKLVAGVVGKNKFAYDVWGDTVNTASRMESSCEIGRINISGSTYDLVKNHFQCTFRGEISVKNRGKVAMYFVE